MAEAEERRVQREVTVGRFTIKYEIGGNGMPVNAVLNDRYMSGCNPVSFTLESAAVKAYPLDPFRCDKFTKLMRTAPDSVVAQKLQEYIMSQEMR